MKIAQQRSWQQRAESIGIWRPAAALLGCLVAACSSSSSGGGDGAACDTHLGSQHVCWDYGGDSVLASNEASGTCATDPGTLVSSCPSEDRLGTCDVPTSGNVTTTVVFYSEGGGTVAGSEDECTQNGGAWTAGS